MKWFRWYHDESLQPWLAVVAKRTKQPKMAVLSVWVVVHEYASKASERGQERGTLKGIDSEEVAMALDMDPEAVETIMAALAVKGKISDSYITDWEDRQPSSDDVAARVKKSRENKKLKRNCNVTPTLQEQDSNVTETELKQQSNVTVTPMKHDVTVREEEKRTEHNRTEREHIARASDKNFLEESPYRQQIESCLVDATMQDRVSFNRNLLANYLAREFDRILSERPELKPDDLVECWSGAISRASSQRVCSENYVKQTFIGKVAEFDPTKRARAAPAGKPRMCHWQTLVDSEKIRNRHKPEVVYRGKDFTYQTVSMSENTAANRLVHKNNPELILDPDDYVPV